MLDATLLGTDRQNAHPNGTPRYYNNPNQEDIIGMAGEIAFVKRYGLRVDTTIRPGGDGHIDFEIDFNGERTTFDVKTAVKAYNLLVKEWEISKCADVLILAQYVDCEVELLGWESRWVMAKQPTKVFSSLGIKNYYIHRDMLRPMVLIDDFFRNNVGKITQVVR